MAPLKAPKLLWLNEACARSDPQFATFGCDVARYEDYLLNVCAHHVSENVVGTRDAHAIAFADRYGGSGIGLNGGSGRAAILGNYHVKGIGRTPLVSSLTPQSHASGGAYMEECVREAIFAEVVRHEFPCSAVPVLAIIDTGMVKVWETEHGLKHERRTLLVRPNVVRPAHFARAAAFFSGDPKEGSKDTRRVEVFFANVVAAVGKAALTEAFRRFWDNWAQQMAYAFVHRLPHGSNTISNICMDGSLIDFGASSAVPSWANISTMQAPQPFIAQFDVIRRAMRHLSYYCRRHLDPTMDSTASMNVQCASAQRHYQMTVIAEGLRVCGVDAEVAAAAAAGPEHAFLWQAVGTVIAHFQRETFDIRSDMPPPAIPWDLPSVWDDKPPAHLKQWRDIVRDYVPADEQGGAEERCRFIAGPRSHLYREDAKAAIYAALEHIQEQDHADARELVTTLICDQVARGRRDSANRPKHGIPLGFAVNPANSYALFRDRRNAEMFAVDETAGQDKQPGSSSLLTCRTIQHISHDGMRFVGENGAFAGAVALGER